MMPDGLPVNMVRVDASGGRILAGSTNQGVYVLGLQTGGTVAQYLPVGPYMNSFSDLNGPQRHPGLRIERTVGPGRTRNLTDRILHLPGRAVGELQ
jgi:hypothetical protein